MTTTSSSHSGKGDGVQAPTTSQWSSSASKFNIAGGKPPTLPAHYYPLEHYILPKIKTLLAASSEEEVKVLILAGGTGAELELLMEGMEGQGVEKGRVKVTQSDGAEGMLKISEEMATKQGWADQIEFKVLDAQATGLPDASYDIICMLYGPHCLPDPNAGLNEMHRLLTPCGLLVASSPYDLTVWDVVAEAHAATLEHREGGAPAEYRGQHVIKTTGMLKPWVSLEAVKERVHEELGWKKANVETQQVMTVVPDYEELFGGFSSNPGMAFIYRGLQDSEKDSMFEEMMKAGRRRLGAREEGDRKMYMSITSCLITLEK